MKYLFSCLCLLFILFLGQRIYHQQWLVTDLTSLLPQEQTWSPLQIAADQQQTQTLNEQIIALVGSPYKEQSFTLAHKITQLWSESKLFSHINAQVQPDLELLRQEIKTLSFATLPANIIQELKNNPQTYFQDFAEQIVNPFNRTSLVPLDQDWLGFTRFTLAQALTNSKMQWDANSGYLYLEDQGITWVLIQAKLKDANLIGSPQELLTLIHQSQELAPKFLVTGASLFAATTQAQAEKESTYMSVLGISLTLIFLLSVFRSLKVLWLFVPIFIGLIAGISATLIVFERIHVMTLVIGTSLIGVLVDFPLHWLGSSLYQKPWHPQVAMRKLYFTFFISLVVTLLGYLLLGFTALPILKQTALFSSVALVFAIGATVYYLPGRFKHYQAKPINLPTLGIFTRLVQKSSLKKVLFLGISLFTLGGIYQSQWQDNMRQWISVPPSLLKQTQQIAQLAGLDLSTQYLLVVASNDQELLEKNLKLSQQLKGYEFMALSQWIQPLKQQEQLAHELLNKLTPTSYQSLTNLGISSENINESLQALPQQTLDLAQALQTSLGKGWQFLYLGQLDAQHVASVIKFMQVTDPQPLQALANNQDIFWQDKAGHLNQAFKETRDQAAWLKLASFALALIFLLKFFGFKGSCKILVLPLMAIALTIGVLGWLAVPISLFAMFGLLLVSAIGIDYTAYMYTVKEQINAKKLTITLASLTTIISFMLLAFSSTPAVASFGISVSLGVFFTLILIFCLEKT
ncbi:MMPL family transporter [Psittacicella gerlachiana]|uniref:Membrane transport protein MMPL domain-containing protein n=1 Tax=Psittacicella gerlachiana TaxID=2028574 RepID=A0A3A1YGL7_9GAMM|nr:hypothetical protein [Psittacicella gerlachiana]RIY36825.1 hypothetical protein CKF59_02100 [Psittacicella gerlachiana]